MLRYVPPILLALLVSCTPLTGHDRLLNPPERSFPEESQPVTILPQPAPEPTPPEPEPEAEPAPEPEACKPGKGKGDRNHCHSGPKGRR